MKKQIIECFKCKTANEVDFKHPRRVLVCRHCGKKMTLDTKALKHLKLIRYVLLIVVSIGFMFVCSLITTNSDTYLSFIPLIVFVSLMLFFANEADRICLKLLFVLFKEVNYVEYIPEDRNRKRVTKKRGWFR